MFILSVCGTITDSVALLPVGDISKMAPEMDKVRKQIKQLTDTEYLIGQVQKGETMMMHKVAFDNYLKSHVDMMRGCVSNNVPCQFSYISFFNGKPISTADFTIKERWALEMLMTRLNLCSIYHAGAYPNLEKIFNNTASSFEQEYKSAKDFTNNLQVTFRYFFEGYQPLKRISTVFAAIEQLITSEKARQILEFKKDLFEGYRDLVQCNLAFLKLEKYRILQEFKQCKEGAFAIVNRLGDVRLKIQKYQNQGLQKDIFQYIKIGEIFFKVYCLYVMLLQHEAAKVNEDYGFIKKQFQSMLMDNNAAIVEIEKLNGVIKNFPNDEKQDKFMFAETVIDTIMKDVKRLKYKFNINLHENKSNLPSIDDVIGRRIGLRNIWESLEQF